MYAEANVSSPNARYKRISTALTPDLITSAWHTYNFPPKGPGQWVANPTVKASRLLEAPLVLPVGSRETRGWRVGHHFRSTPPSASPSFLRIGRRQGNSTDNSNPAWAPLTDVTISSSAANKQRDIAGGAGDGNVHAGFGFNVGAAVAFLFFALTVKFYAIPRYLRVRRILQHQIAAFSSEIDAELASFGDGASTSTSASTNASASASSLSSSSSGNGVSDPRRGDTAGLASTSNHEREYTGPYLASSDPDDNDRGIYDGGHQTGVNGQFDSAQTKISMATQTTQHAI